jgi:hypothetical protein
MEIVKKNCLTCVHLEYAHGDAGDSEGFVCNRKHFNEREESDMLEKMGNINYRLKSKVCYVPE